MRRGAVARHLEVAPSGANVGDGGHGDAQFEIELFPRERGHRFQRAFGEGGVLGGDEEARAVAAEHEREGFPLQRVRDRGDHPGADHVDRLVAPGRHRRRRSLDVGEAGLPVVRSRPVRLRGHRRGEILDHGQRSVEIGAHGTSLLSAGHQRSRAFSELQRATRLDGRTGERFRPIDGVDEVAPQRHIRRDGAG